MNGLLIFGDSITHGPNDGSGWANLLKREFEKRGEYYIAYNLGIPGDTSTSLRKRFKIECDARVRYYLPSNKFVIVIAIGINDSRLWNGKPETSETAFRKNIESLVRVSRQYKCPVALMGLTPVDKRAARYDATAFTNERIERYNTIISDVAKQHSIPFVDIYVALVKKNCTPWLSDGLHWNSTGNKVLFATISKQLRAKKLIPHV